MRIVRSSQKVVITDIIGNLTVQSSRHQADTVQFLSDVVLGKYLLAEAREGVDGGFWWFDLDHVKSRLPVVLRKSLDGLAWLACQEVVAKKYFEGKTKIGEVPLTEERMQGIQIALGFLTGLVTVVDVEEDDLVELGYLPELELEE